MVNGEFAPIYEYFPDLIEFETRKVCLMQETYGLPAGVYYLLESYCIDPDCDCRKVMINVQAQSDKPRVLGTVGYGWEGEEFYIKWTGDEKLGRHMVGTYLEPGGVGTEYSQNCLKLVNNSLRDPHYVNMIKRHYIMLKDKIIE